MKIKFLLIISLMAVSSCFPQGMTDKGSMSISGGLAYSSSNYKNDNTKKTLSIVPGVSFFVVKNFEVGFNLRFSYSESETAFFLDWNLEGKSKEIERAFGIGPFLTYYFGNAPVKPYIFTAYSFNKGSGSVDYGVMDLSFKTDYKYHSLFLGGGCLIPLAEKLAITPFLQYEISRYEKNDENENNIDELDHNTISFGAQLKMFL